MRYIYMILGMLALWGAGCGKKDEPGSIPPQVKPAQSAEDSARIRRLRKNPRPASRQLTLRIRK
jgi:hypothetical protein